MRSVSILIVDDEPHVRTLLKAVLGGKYSCVAAESAEKAMPLLALRHFDVVLVDIVLEGLNGLDFCRVIKQLSPRTAVVMISGKMDPGIGRNAWASGASAFLAKPFDLSDVTDVVEQSVYKFRQSVA